MPRAAAVRQADIDRVVKTLAKNGLTVASVEVRAGGVVMITPGLTGAGPQPLPDSLDARRALRAGRASQGPR